MATLFQLNPRSESGGKEANYEAFKYQKLDHFKIMAASSSSLIPTPLAHADIQKEGHPREASIQAINVLKAWSASHIRSRADYT
ncbi:hypothetical protein TNCV_4532021 [Trichonephila clavipes]|nr:hypothetical protein TNCV_4532021 [Trichonephila clavipes]